MADRKEPLEVDPAIIRRFPESGRRIPTFRSGGEEMLEHQLFKDRWREWTDEIGDSLLGKRSELLDLIGETLFSRPSWALPLSYYLHREYPDMAERLDINPERLMAWARGTEALPHDKGLGRALYGLIKHRVEELTWALGKFSAYWGKAE